NQMPITSPSNRAGASLVIVLRPTGLRHISPTVCRKNRPSSQIGPTLLPSAVSLAAGIIQTKDRATNSRPSANFAGLEGWRRPSLIHSQAKSGARVITQAEFTDCHQVEGYS